MEALATWLADPTRRDLVAAYALLISIGSTILTAVGLTLTYFQARNARLSAEDVKREVENFEFRKSIYDAIGDVGEARTAMDAAGKFLKADSWAAASSYYDDARKALVSLQLGAPTLPDDLRKKIKIICEHLVAFSNGVDAALVEKGSFPEKTKVLAAIRRHSDVLSAVHNELQRENR